MNHRDNASLYLQPPKLFTPPSVGEEIQCNNILYYIGRQIGQGAFGTVYECTDEWGNNLVAKVLVPYNRQYEQVKEEWLSEFNNLRLLRHPNITYMHQAFEYRDTFYLIVERCDLSLGQLISAGKIGGDIWLPYVARDVLHGLDYIHNRNVVHKDLHPANIYGSRRFDPMAPLNEPVWRFKIGDLGISRLEGDMHLFNAILAPWMLPPEYLAPKEFGLMGKHIDIYHAGLLFLNLLLGKVPKFTENEIIGGKPRAIAENLNSPYAGPIARALRRHIHERTQSAIQLWREISQVNANFA